MQIVYPRPQSDCPNYFEIGGNKWRNEVRIANKFGAKSNYNIGDTVDTIAFYFPDSLIHKQNQVIIERGIIESTFIWKEYISYTIRFSNGCSKLTSTSYIRAI